MKMHRRNFLKTAGLTLGGAGMVDQATFAQTAKTPNFVTGATKMKLGIVTYNIAKDWDVPTLIKNCTETGFQGAELRTTHAHRVEVTVARAIFVNLSKVCNLRKVSADLQTNLSLVRARH